jgi:hypothetical protein
MKLVMAQLLTLAVALAQVSCAAGGGKTLTRGQFRSDTELCVLYLDESVAPECKNRKIVDTELLERFTDGTWSERWTVNRCGKLIKCKLNFFPQPNGTMKIDAKMED